MSEAIQLSLRSNEELKAAEVYSAAHADFQKESSSDLAVKPRLVHAECPVPIAKAVPKSDDLFLDLDLVIAQVMSMSEAPRAECRDLVGGRSFVPAEPMELGGGHFPVGFDDLSSGEDDVDQNGGIWGYDVL